MSLLAALTPVVEVFDRIGVLGLLRTRGRDLDGGYLDEWAPRLGVGDLLARARGEARSS